MTASSRVRKRELQTLADFRYELRRFLRFSERTVAEAGLTPLQYQMLLQVGGWRGRDGPTVGELAERLQSAQHGVVALVTRAEQAGLVERRYGTSDRRRVYVCLTPHGEKALHRIASAAWRELASLSRFFRVERLSAYNDRQGNGKTANGERSA